MKRSISSSTKKFVIFSCVYIATARVLTLFILSLCTDIHLDVTAMNSNSGKSAPASVSLENSKSAFEI